MLEQLPGRVLRKTRSRIDLDGRAALVDVLHGLHEGLVLLEVGFAAEEDLMAFVVRRGWARSRLCRAATWPRSTTRTRPAPPGIVAEARGELVGVLLQLAGAVLEPRDQVGDLGRLVRVGLGELCLLGLQLLDAAVELGLPFLRKVSSCWHERICGRGPAAVAVQSDRAGSWAQLVSAETTVAPPTARMPTRARPAMSFRIMG